MDLSLRITLVYQSALTVAITATPPQFFEDNGSWTSGYYWGTADNKQAATIGACTVSGGCRNKIQISSNHCRLYPLTGFTKSFYKSPCNSSYHRSQPYCGTLPPAIASQKNDDKPLFFAGNPIDIVSGNKSQTESAFNLLIPLQLSYNSNTGRWLHNYQQQISTVSTNQILITRPDGKGLVFSLIDETWLSDADIIDRLTDLSSNTRCQVTTPEGAFELYDEQGRLLSITTLQGNSTTLTYSGQTTTVINHLGDTLQLTYGINDHLIRALFNNEINHSFNFDGDDRLLSRTDHSAPATNITS